MSTETSVDLPPPSPEEQQVTTDLASAVSEQLGVVEQQAQLQRLLFEQIPGFFQSTLEAANQTGQPLETLGLSQEEKDLLNQTVTNALGLGEADINRYRDEGLNQIRDVLAPGRGLRPDDSPILNEAANVVREAQIQQGQLTRALRGTQAQSEFDRIFDRDKLRALLRQSAFENRLNLATGASSVGLGLNPNINIPSALAAIQQPRLAQTTTTQSGAAPAAQVLSGTGSLFSGIGDIFAGWNG